MIFFKYFIQSCKAIDREFIDNNDLYFGRIVTIFLGGIVEERPVIFSGIYLVEALRVQYMLTRDYRIY